MLYAGRVRQFLIVKLGSSAGFEISTQYDWSVGSMYDGKDDIMQLGNVDGFFRALSTHEVTSTPGLKRTAPFLPSGSIMWVDFSRAHSAGLKKAGL